MSDKPKRGIAVRAPERFEVLVSPPTAHLAPAQQRAKRGIAVRAPERFEVIPPLPTFQLKLHLASAFGDSDLLELARAVGAALTVLSDIEIALGGSGLKLVAQDAKHRVVTLTLAHARAEGASERAARLRTLFQNALAPAGATPSEHERFLQLREHAPCVANWELVLPRAA